MPSEWLDRKPASHFHIEPDDRICKLPELRNFANSGRYQVATLPSLLRRLQKVNAQLCVQSLAQVPPKLTGPGVAEALEALLQPVLVAVGPISVGFQSCVLFQFSR